VKGDDRASVSEKDTVRNEISIHYAELPKTKLRYAKCGEGPAVIIVPATISWIEDWIPMIQMMGTRFTAYFFELPGHGKSSAFTENFSSDLVAESVEAFADYLSIDRFSLMGFSFGGILAMKTLSALEDRIDQVIFFAPVLTKRALLFSKPRHFFLQSLISSLKRKPIRTMLSKVATGESSSHFFASLIRYIGKVEPNVSIESIFNKFTPNSIETMTYQFDEILKLKIPSTGRKFLMPCYFFMSVNDPMVEYNATVKEAGLFFNDLRVRKLFFHYHQPPETPSFEEFIDLFHEFLMAQDRSII
jgi:pimeloyl-ACP methyl ester carboxylesterase